jgi:hypothetical protein
LFGGAWERARALFAAALEVAETPEGLEGLGAAAFFLDDAVASLDSRERAFRLYWARDDRLGAARVAIALATDHYYHRGDRGICNGWVQRAHRMLDGLDLSLEHGLLAWWEGHLALKADRDAEGARRGSARAVEIARSFGETDLELLALSLEGLALVSLGDTLEGMRRLDEATAAAVAGEINDVDTNVTACCYLIAACELVRDDDRAARWCEHAREVAERYSYRFMFSYCRTQYAGVLMHWGEWAAAEQELLAAVAHLEATKPPAAGGGVCRLAELRRWQGRLVEAAELYDRAEQPPLRVEAGPDVLLGRAALALDEGEAEVLMWLGRHADARREARAAAVVFGRLGATRDVGRAEALLAVFPGSVPAGPAAAAGLTAARSRCCGWSPTGLATRRSPSGWC